MNATPSIQLPASPALAACAKFVVGLTLILIFIGGLVTSWQAGMAVPDWPLSFGSVNPEGWWANVSVRLEHGHRLFAMFVGVLTGILCSWVWGQWRPLLVAALVSAALPEIFRAFGTPKSILMHLHIWPAALAFVLTLLYGVRRPVGALDLPEAVLPRTQREAAPQHSRASVAQPKRRQVAALQSELRPQDTSATVRWLALAAFICVCVQATLGGLRVTRETAGAMDVALALRIAHGCFAQAFLCIVVAIATLLSARWLAPIQCAPSKSRAIRRLSWITVGAVFLQLIVGATMRHLGAGLAIPTFPQATPDGRLLPAVRNAFVDLNFAHTRVGAVVVTLLIIVLIALVLRAAPGEPQLIRPALLMGAIVSAQIILGMFVIWHLKPRTLTTFHVANGAVLLSTCVLFALRARRFSARTPPPMTHQERCQLTEAAA